MHGRTVTVKLRTPDFTTLTRRKTPELPPQSGDDLARIAVDLLGKFPFAPTARFRLAGVGVSNFSDEEDGREPLLFA